MNAISGLLLVLFVVGCTAQTITFWENRYSGSSAVKQVRAGDNTCVNLGDFASKTSSVTTSGIDGVQIFDGVGCTGQQTTLFAPISSMGDLWNDRAVSYRAATTILPAVGTYATTAASYGECAVALYVDNYAVKPLLQTLTIEKIRAKYTAYFSDINSYYATHFNIKLTLKFLYLESSGSFNDTTNGGALLGAFVNQVKGNKWPGIPSDICVHHLITGRNPTGVVGLAYEDTVCNPAFGFSVDSAGQDFGGLVLRRSIHEITHNFHGSHPDGYTGQNPPYTCSVDNDIGVYRIMKREANNTYERAAAADTNSVVPMIFVEAGSRLSQCAEASVSNAASSWSCLYGGNQQTSLPTISLYADGSFGGAVLALKPRRGNDSCYDIARFGVSSIKVANGVKGIIAYKNQDCRGTSQTWSTFPMDRMPDGFNDNLQSLKFVL